jgi:hypothetical protein
MTWSTVFAWLAFGPIANNLAFIEYDPVIINADHDPDLVIEDF